MVFSVSPSVTVREVDLTSSIPAIGTPPAAIAGVFRWGPINERVLISSEIELATTFGAPSDLNAETFFAAADFLSYSNAIYVTRVVDNAAAVAQESAGTAYFEARYPGLLGNDLDVAYVSIADDGENANNNFETHLLDTSIFTTDEATGYTIEFGENVITLRLRDVFQDPIANTTFEQSGLTVGDILRMGNSDVGYQEFTIVDLDLTPAIVTVANTSVGVIDYTITLDKRYTLTEDVAQNLDIIRKWGYANLFESAPAPGDFHVVVVDRVGKISGQAGSVLERFSNLSTSPTAKFSNGANRYYVDVIENGSRWIRPTENNRLTDVVARQYGILSGGADSAGEAAIAIGPLARGYDLYREANEIDISFVIQGRPSEDLANYLISNIAEYRKDCMLFLSPRQQDVVGIASPQDQMTNILGYRAGLQNSSYWFMDSGYKYRYDKYNDVFRWVPMNGDMAGLASLVQPWESPAGYRKGRVRNVIKLAFNPNKAQRDQLYGKDVNPVITQTGQGTILFGDKTGFGTATGSAFTRINVRRLFITVEKAIATVSAQLLFEFNDEFTQNQFRQIVGPFLRDIQGRRGIIDFRVVSDATVNTPQVVDANTFRANIFIKPARSINFIELTFVATRTGVEFEEIVGQQF
jgi:hypothetical protein